MKPSSRDGRGRRPVAGTPTRVIRASEVGEYSYCSRAWWYKHVVKLAAPDTANSDRLVSGIEAHARHGRSVAHAATLRRVAFALAICGLAILALTFILMRR
ncbi:MAG: hypothetical protein IVW55_15635 [Chloroflexi bacterium]|nr:hypothetical protein [Chloroflexota bacterium]